MIHYMTVQGVGDAWVANELRIVSREGIPFALHALRRPKATYFTSDDVAAMNRRTLVLYPVGPFTVLLAVLLAPFRFGARFWGALGDALFGPRESWRARAKSLWHLGVACDWAAKLDPAQVSLIHSQWIHSAGTVAMYGAWLIDRPFSFTGHAADLFRERVALKSKIDRAEFIICISEFHREFFLSEGADPAKLKIAYCGLDMAHFAPRPHHRGDGDPWHILSAGRLVEKKGFDVFIRAVGRLHAEGRAVRATIAGSGPLEEELRAQIAGAALQDVITLTGEALKQEDIPDFMASGDIFTLHCVWAKDRDVDGLPQMLMEAMACGLPAVSTDLVGIPDLIHHEETGLLVLPQDPTALANALMRLAHDEPLATRLALTGRERVTSYFDINTCLEPLLARYRDALEQSR